MEDPSLHPVASTLPRPDEEEDLEWQPPDSSRPSGACRQAGSTCLWQPYIPPRTVPYCPPWRWVHDYESRRVCMDPPPVKNERREPPPPSKATTAKGDEFLDELRFFSASEFCHLVKEHLHKLHDAKKARAQSLRREYEGEGFPGRTSLLEKIRARQMDDPVFFGLNQRVKTTSEFAPHERYVDYLRGEMDPTWLSWHPEYDGRRQRRAPLTRTAKVEGVKEVVVMEVTDEAKEEGWLELGHFTCGALERCK